MRLKSLGNPVAYCDTRDRAAAELAARSALNGWYQCGSRAALRGCISEKYCREIRQRNLQSLDRWPHWKSAKNLKDAYVMLVSPFSGRVEPVALRLTYDLLRHRNLVGSLSRRGLHQQLRAHLRLKPKQSLRVCLDRPWYRYWTQRIPVPEEHAIPADNAKSSPYWGMTLRYYVHTHLREENERNVDDEKERA